MTKPERISLVELDRRMAMFDPYLPRGEVIEGLQALHDAVDEAALWRRICLACLAVTSISVLVASGVVLMGTTQATQLLVYEKMCLTPEVAEVMVKTSEAITITNSVCLDQHRKDREFLQAMFAKSDAIYKAADKAGVMYAIGDSYEDVPVLPNTKATYFFLHGEDQVRRSGLVVQAVQQHQAKAAP